MAILKPEEIRELSIREMEEKLRELQAELARERTLSKAGGTAENPGKIKEIKRTIARLLTIMKEVQEERSS